MKKTVDPKIIACMLKYLKNYLDRKSLEDIHHGSMERNDADIVLNSKYTKKKKKKSVYFFGTHKKDSISFLNPRIITLK